MPTEAPATRHTRREEKAERTTSPPVLEVGVVGKPHGLRGEVYVDLITDRTERLDPGSRLMINGAWLTVRTSKPQQHRWLVFFDGLDDREAVARHTSARIYAEPIEDPDALWVHELVGAIVRTSDGGGVGRCVGVVANPASDLLELDSGLLVPVRFVTGTETDGDRVVVTIDPPAGLIDDDADVDDGDDAADADADVDDADADGATTIDER